MASSPKATAPAISSAQAAACIALAVVAALGGGLAIGWLLTWRVYGNLGFMLLGFIAGWSARRINGRGVPWVGAMLAAAIFVAFYIAEMSWLHWAGAQGAETWAKAAKLTLSLPQDGTGVFIIGLVCTLFGAYSAWWWGGSRWRMMLVPDER